MRRGSDGQKGAEWFRFSSLKRRWDVSIFLFYDLVVLNLLGFRTKI